MINQSVYKLFITFKKGIEYLLENIILFYWFTNICKLLEYIFFNYLKKSTIEAPPSNISKPCLLLHSNKSFKLCHIFVGWMIPQYIINNFIFQKLTNDSPKKNFLHPNSMNNSSFFSFHVPILLVSCSIMFINSFLWNKLEILNFHIL